MEKFIPRPLKTPEDIANLPWGGNYQLDRELWLMVEAFIAKLPEGSQQKHRAEVLASWYICGEHAPNKDKPS